MTAVKEKDTKIRRIEQEHVQIQNDLIIKNMKLLQEREETYRTLSNRNKQIDEYKYNINDMTMKLEQLKHEIIFNEDKLFEENEMLKSHKLKNNDEPLDFNLKGKCDVKSSSRPAEERKCEWSDREVTNEQIWIRPHWHSLEVTDHSSSSANHRFVNNGPR